MLFIVAMAKLYQNAVIEHKDPCLTRNCADGMHVTDNTMNTSRIATCIVQQWCSFQSYNYTLKGHHLSHTPMNCTCLPLQ